MGKRKNMPPRIPNRHVPTGEAIERAKYKEMIRNGSGRQGLTVNPWLFYGLVLYLCADLVYLAATQFRP